MSVPYAEVIGDPISQAKSPLIHKFWLAALGMEGDYKRFRVPAEELADYLAGACADADWRGCNVTIPHKVAIVDLVGDPGGIRPAIGAMNTVTRAADGSLVGANTDADGFGATIRPFGLEESHAVVVGAGGAARAVLYALAKARIGRVTVQNRDVAKAARLLSHFGVEGDAVPLGSALPHAALLVNASALGMIGRPPLDLDLAALPDDALVYDIVYAPLETSLLAQARARGLRVIDGLEMLIAQAALAFTLFFGAEPPRERDGQLRTLLTS
jgi:shikimate dehydrogenase